MLRKLLGVGGAVWLVAAVLAVPFASASGGCRNTTGGSLKSCVIGHASITGDYATTVATGRAVRPSVISVVVYTRPAQSVHVAWTMVCTRGFGASTKSGHFTRRTFRFGGEPTPTAVHDPFALQTLRMPVRRPSGCTVSADAQLSRSGWLLVQILAIRRR